MPANTFPPDNTSKQLPKGWWNGVPAGFKEYFERKTLRQGYVLYIQGRVSLLGFFRNVYRASIKDGSDFHCLYSHDESSVLKASRARLLCDCHSAPGSTSDACAHLAALLFQVYADNSEKPCGQAYPGGLWAQLALGLCRTHAMSLSPSNPSTQHYPQGSILKDGKNKTVLSIDIDSDSPCSWTRTSLFHNGWESSETGGRYLELCREAILPVETQSLKLMGHTPSLRAEFSPVGELCRQIFLWVRADKRASMVEGRLDWDMTRELFRVTLKDAAAHLTVHAFLQCDQAFSLSKKFPEITLEGGFAENSEAWLKGLELRVEPTGGVRIRSFATGPLGEKIFPQPGNVDFRFGDKPMLPGIGFRALIVPTGALFKKYTGWKIYSLTATSVMDFLKLYGSELASSLQYDVDPLLREGSRSASVQGIGITALERVGRRFRLCLEFRLGAATIDLTLLKSISDAGQNGVITAGGFVDFSAPEWTWLGRIKPDAWVENQKSWSIWISMPLLMRLCVQASAKQIEVSGERFPELQALPTLVHGSEIKKEYEEPLPVNGLRPYQVEGVRWLAHLVSCGVSGILADDMGLGKTHQVMALAAWLHKRSRGSVKILVVCPTSVLYHWKEKLDVFHPDLGAALYYGVDRKLETLDAKVCITSYGVARRDIAILRGFEFDLLVLDEIQNAKNRDSETHRSFQEFPATTIIGLSGTPLENSPLEVKNLFDLLLPDYFPGESQFRREILDPLINRQGEAEARERFLALCRPFLLRRNKADVLQDLPEKVEETYHCDMTPEQAELYRDCIVNRGGALLQSLRGSGPTNLMHIFQLLTRLKQICNHPMTVSDLNVDSVGSGKWDLFTELLEQALDAGNKVVVFSQYLSMLAWIEAHLKLEGIGFASLTGSTRDREGVLKRFREAADCRVFCCSLKAGGVGIDLTAASTVIHYDRWWNAARENQATDRVHRIGQPKNVQVFKLVTRGTIEERIDAIIRKKAAWMDTLLPDDGEGGVQLFTREELMDLLRV